MVRATVSGWYIIIETDDSTVENFLRFSYTKTEFNAFTKKYQTVKKNKKLFERTKKDQKTGHQFYLISLGWAPYIIPIFSAYLPAEDVQNLRNGYFAPYPRTTPFQELRDNQNGDILHILKHRMALFSVYTGYGKSQCISVLAKYFSQDLGKKVLLVTPSTKPRDELVKRIKDLYGIEVPVKKFGGPGKIQTLITQGFTNRKDYKDPVKREALKKELESFDILLVDEVEYCINESGEFIFGACSNVECKYAFSGTSDRMTGEIIDFKNGLTPSIGENFKLINIFGQSVVFDKPKDKIIDYIQIESQAMAKVNLGGEDVSANIYNNVMTKLFTDDDICKLIIRIAKKFPLLYIPVNNLVNMINHWIDSYFLGKLRVLLICGEGYIYIDLQGNRTKVDLAGACEYIQRGMVDVIPSTSSGFRALDLPGLSNTLLIAGSIAGMTLQQVGRVARSEHMNIITLVPKGKRKLPVYTEESRKREELIKNYYEGCKITTVYLSDTDIEYYNGEDTAPSPILPPNSI